MLPKQLSHRSPAMEMGDFNNDGLEDLIIGGGVGQQTSLFLQQKNGNMIGKKIPDFSLDTQSLDTDISVSDFDKDGNLDIYIASGGYHNFNPNDIHFQDRIYLGDGMGGFKKDNQALPQLLENTSTIAIGDINNDSHPDIFVGGGIIPGRYPETSPNYILVNDGNGKFQIGDNANNEILKIPGLVTDAKFADINGDGALDLFVVGEWMPISIFINHNGNFKNETSSYFNKEYKGLWTTIEIQDINDDGRLDIVAGNLGTNIQFKIDEKHPATLVYDDFDKNGAIDPILNFYVGETSYPYLTER
ncbi:VCBS repeat-containing protein [Maribacter litopenaei]|uniref:VCBS repeat-containing protein n=1 Tax=Maribacter litopenaei TaxID=2976127 RepID=A0ABY5YAN3_9FLAO|nr:VCBS repeat-containing protein [Maribacter litopenaei]UWX55175.1 VCBS repeat-containing protein [Maribacter litopenaei]